jgi:hypothetical protein
MNWQRYNLHAAEWGMPEISVHVLNVNIHSEHSERSILCKRFVRNREPSSLTCPPFKQDLCIYQNPFYELRNERWDQRVASWKKGNEHTLPGTRLHQMKSQLTPLSIRCVLADFWMLPPSGPVVHPISLPLTQPCSCRAELHPVIFDANVN